MGETESFDVLVSEVAECRESDAKSWVKEVRESGGDSVFAMEAFWLCSSMEVSESGQKVLVDFFDVMGFDKDLVAEAGRAEALFYHSHLNTFAATDWKFLAPDVIEMFESFLENFLFNTGENLFWEDHVADAYWYFESLARYGNGRAQYVVGEYLVYGWGNVREAERTGFSYYRKGASKDALCAVMQAYEPGAEKEKILAETAPKVLNLAKGQDAEAQMRWADVLEGNIDFFAGEGLSILNEAGFFSLEEARRYAKACVIRAAECMYWPAILRLADENKDEKRCGEKRKDSGNWFQKMFQTKKILSKNRPQVIYFLKKLYDLKGDHRSEAFVRILDLYEKEGQKRQAKTWSEKCAAEFDEREMFRIGYCYGEGKCVEENPERDRMVSKGVRKEGGLCRSGRV